MGFESMPKAKAEDNSEQSQGGAERWIETVGKKGEKVSIGVFAGESDAEAMDRAKRIDDQLAKEGASESTLS